MSEARPPDRPLAGEELLRRYREGLGERIAALEGALAQLPASDEADREIRELAHVLRGSGTSYGYPVVTERAARTEEAPPGSLREECEALLAELRRIAQPVAGAGSTVLVVEDDPEIRYLLEVILGSDGREVLAVDRGSAARAILDVRPVDVVVLDLVLPDMDGRSLLRHIRERPATADVPVVVLSAHGESRVQTECFGLGADAYFRKPFDPELLEAAVATHAARGTRKDREARQDALTGLLNRAGVKEMWEADEDRAVRTLALVELDGFDQVEMRHGWTVAENALARAGAAIEGAAPDARGVGRWEGESFVMVFDGEADQARSAVAGALEAVRRSPVRGPDGETFRLTASAGLAAGADGEDLGDVMDAARSALYRARAAGGNRIGGADGDEEQVGRRRVIVAEDDDITASLLRHRLERDGFDVEWHPNGADAYEAALRAHPDLVILDVRMPGMDGFELLERLRKVEAFRSVPIVLLTSMGSEADLVRGFGLGADDYMLKPFSPTEFLARIRRLVSRRP